MVATLIIGFVSGAVLGGLHFAGLWYTVARLGEARHPLALLFISTALRITVLCLGLYLVTVGHAAGLLAALVGVLAARLALTRYSWSV